MYQTDYLLEQILRWFVMIEHICFPISFFIGGNYMGKTNKGSLSGKHLKCNAW